MDTVFASVMAAADNQALIRIGSMSARWSAAIKAVDFVTRAPAGAVSTSLPEGGAGTGGLVVTNSGRAVADSGDNLASGAPDGFDSDVESGSANAEGNRSTIHVGP